MASEKKGTILQDLLVVSMSTLIGAVVLWFTASALDPNRAQAKKAAERKKEIAKRLDRPNLVTNTYEDIIACNVINPDQIDVTFDSIGGLEDVKQSLKEIVILPLLRPELFRSKILKPEKGVLLYGPPGTGKTLLAKAIAKESNAAFINLRISSIMSKWFGDAQKLVVAVFTLAHKLQPAVIFVDEVDSFLARRKESEHEAVTTMKTEFMSQWDGFDTDQNARVMVLAATNRPEELDDAILRRLPRAFEIPLPDLASRESILRITLEEELLEENFDMTELAKKCEGYSGSDLVELCKQAAYAQVRYYLDQEKKKMTSSTPINSRPLKMEDFDSVLKTSRLTKDAASEYARRGFRSNSTFDPNPPRESVSLQSFVSIMQLLNSLRNTSTQNGGAE